MTLLLSPVAERKVTVLELETPVTGGIEICSVYVPASTTKVTLLQTPYLTKSATAVVKFLYVLVAPIVIVPERAVESDLMVNVSFR